MKKTFIGRQKNELVINQYDPNHNSIGELTLETNGIWRIMGTNNVLDISTYLIKCAHKMGASKAEIVKPLLELLRELYPEGVKGVTDEWGKENERERGGA